MSYTDYVARPFSRCRTMLAVSKAIKGSRFNGFDCTAWGTQLRRYPVRRRTFRAIRLKRRFAA